MNKCLVSKLGATITSPNPRILGRAEIKVTSNALASMWITSSITQTITALDPDGLTLKTQVVNAGNRIEFTLGNISSYDYIIIVIPHAYAITRLYGHNLTNFNGDPSAIYRLDLRDFNFGQLESQTEMGGNLDVSQTDFNEDLFLEWTSIIFDESNYIKRTWSNIENLGGMIKLEQCNTQSVDGNWYIKGDLKKVLEHQCYNGRTTGSISMGLYGNLSCDKVTFDEEYINWTQSSATFNENGCELIGGTNWNTKFNWNRAVFNKFTGLWSYYAQ